MYDPNLQVLMYTCITHSLCIGSLCCTHMHTQRNSHEQSHFAIPSYTTRMFPLLLILPLQASNHTKERSGIVRLVDSLMIESPLFINVSVVGPLILTRVVLNSSTFLTHAVTSVRNLSPPIPRPPVSTPVPFLVTPVLVPSVQQ